MKGSLAKIGTILGIALLVVAIDQGVKRLVMGTLPLGGSHPLIPGIVFLSYRQNDGVAFSLLRGMPISAMIALVLLVLGIFIGLAYPHLQSRGGTMAAVLIIGGALGNLIDRISYHYVVDYIDLRVWPVFNIADMAIVIGVIILVLTLFFTEREKLSLPGGKCS